MINEEIFSDIWDLDEWIDNNIEELKAQSTLFPTDCRIKYLDLLFELFRKTKDLTDITEEICDPGNESDVRYLIDAIEAFLDSYSMVLRFYKFTKVKELNGFWSNFNWWKNKRFELLGED